MCKKLLLFIFGLFHFFVQAQNFNEILGKAFTSKDSSDYYFKKAKAAISNVSEEGEYYFCKNAWHGNFGSKDSSLYYANLSVPKLKEAKSYNSLFTVYNNIANSYNDKGKYDQAIKNRFEALKVAEAQNVDRFKGMVYTSLSYDYHDFENYERGVFYGKKAIQIFVNKENVKAKDIHSAFNATAINYDDWNKPEEALFYHKQNLKYIKGKDTLLLHNTFNNIGNTLLKQKKFSEAKKWVLRSLKIVDFKVKQNNFDLTDYSYATCYTNLATIASELNQFEEAEKYFNLAFIYSKKSETAEKLRDYYFQKAAYNKKRNNLLQTVKEQENYIKFRDSVYSAERNQTVEELETKYQTEKKQKELSEAKLDLAENEISSKRKNFFLLLLGSFIVFGFVLFKNYRSKAKLQKEQLLLENQLLEEQSNFKIQEQRLTISKELHDNIGSQLTFMISILDNLKGSSVNFDENITKKIDSLSNFANNSISELRDSIWVLNAERLLLSELKSRMLNFIKDASDAKEELNFKFDFQIQNDVELNSNQAINLYRVIQEIVNNSIKHSKAKDINLNVFQKNEFLEITISDNGVGFDYEELKNKSFGLTNIQKRIRDINGKVEVISDSEKGTDYSIKVALEL